MMLAASVAPLGCACTNQRVQLVDEQNDFCLRWKQSLSGRALRRSSNSPRYFAPAIIALRSIATRRLFLSVSGTSTADDPAGEGPRQWRFLPTPGSPMSTGLFFGAPCQDLHHTANLLVASDDRVDLALAGQRGEIAAIFFERLKFSFRIGIGDALVAAQFGEGARNTCSRLRPFVWNSFFSELPPWSNKPSRRCSVLMYSSLSLPASAFGGIEGPSSMLRSGNKIGGANALDLVAGGRARVRVRA